MTERFKTYIEPGGARSISWTETRKIAIGHHPCGNCGVDSPSPTMDQLLDFAMRRDHDGTLWPGSGHDQDSFLPAGWSYDYDLHLLCPACTAAKKAALDALKQPRSP